MSGDVPGISLWNPYASWAVQLGKLAVVSSKMHELQRQLHGGGGGEGGGLLPCKPISMKIACVKGRRLRLYPHLHRITPHVSANVNRLYEQSA